MVNELTEGRIGSHCRSDVQPALCGVGVLKANLVIYATRCSYLAAAVTTFHVSKAMRSLVLTYAARGDVTMMLVFPRRIVGH